MSNQVEPCGCVNFSKNGLIAKYCSKHLAENLSHKKHTMTPLNTIIEEEKTTAEQIDEIALSRVTSINGVLLQMWDRNVLSAYIDGKLATAIQRAYEAGRKESNGNT